MTASRAELLARHPDATNILDALSTEAKAAMYRDWRFHARPEQIAPSWAWRWWAVVTGRGWGKNRTGSEWSLDRCQVFAERRAPHLLGLMNATYGDVRALQIGGISGIERAAARRGQVVDIPKSKLEGRIRTWTTDGWHDTDVEIHTADQPDRVRGRNFHTLNADEAGKWKHKPDTEGNTGFTNADLGLRSPCPPGLNPQGIVTTTPKPIPLVRDLLAGEYGATAISRGSLYENLANLAPEFIDAVMRRYAGSRLGAQEIEGLLLENVEGALWSGLRIEATRVKVIEAWSIDAVLRTLPPLVRVVVGVDPSGGESGTCGIIVAGMGWLNGLPHLYLLEDCSASTRADEYARTAVDAYHRWRADSIVFETNYGGDMGPALIRMVDAMVNVEVVTATRGKAVRAEPIATLWSPEQSRGHVVGWWPETEEQLVTWVQGDAKSPDRLDALVWCGWSLLGDLTAVDQTRAYGTDVAAARI